jgi:RNA polymerase sigma-70 factor (ECF subfamily)
LADQDLNTLIQRIAKRDQKAYRAFYDAFYPGFFRLAHYYTHSNEMAEEVALDVFEKLWRMGGKLRDIKDHRNYFFTAIKNQSLRYKERMCIETDGLTEYMHSELIEYVEPEKLYIGNELADIIEKTVGELPPRCQLIFRMIREDGLKYREVAEVMHISQKAVENQMLIAMKRLRKALDSYNLPVSRSRSSRQGFDL